MENNRVLYVILVVSIMFNLVFGGLLIKSNLDFNSYEGTWKCTSDSLYEITIFVDHHGTFYEAVFPVTNAGTSDIALLKDMPRIVYKGYIEKDSLVYTGVRILESGDSYEYLSDIPEAMYDDANYFYKINRNSKNTLLIEIPGDTNTKYTFVRTVD